MDGQFIKRGNAFLYHVLTQFKVGHFVDCDFNFNFSCVQMCRLQKPCMLQASFDMANVLTSEGLGVVGMYDFQV